MPQIKKALYLEIQQMLEDKMRSDQYELMKNKGQIKLLADRQKLLKKRVSESGKLLSEFKGKR